MKTVYLHGKLGQRFGKKWELHASSIQEVFIAIDANSEGFLQYILQSDYQGDPYFILTKDPEQINSEEDLDQNLVSDQSLTFLSDQEEIHLMPCAQGAFVFSAIAAVAGVVVGLAAKFAAASFITKMIVFGVVQAAIMALTKPPKPPERKDPTNSKSFLISGAQTRQAQGIAVPLGYGRLKIGTSNVATRITNKKISTTKNADVLESYTEMEFLDLLCEGPIEGFVNKYGGAISGGDIREGIFLNDVQVKSTETGQLNYILNENESSSKGSPVFKNGAENDTTILSNEVFFTKQYDTQLYGPGPYNKSNKAQGEYNSISEAKNNAAKVMSHFVYNRNVNKIIVSLRAEMMIQNDDGSTKKNSIRFAILMSRYNDEYNVLDSRSGCSVKFEEKAGISKVSAQYNSYFLVSGIATSTYQFDITIKYNPELNSPEVSGGVTFKLIKLSAEYDNSVKGGEVGGVEKNRKLQLAHIVEVIDEKLLYPHSAMCKILIDGKNFNKAPDRNYHVKMKKVLIPSNYNPVSRKYDGPWNGLFKGQTDAAQSINEISDNNKYWSDNPAWVFFDLLHNPRYGIGKYGLEESNIDKWELYKVAKYCDQLVETDFPIETSTGSPRSFVSSGTYSTGSFQITVNTNNFAEEFGNNSSFNGKKVAFFIFQHNYGTGNLSNAQQNVLRQRSIDRNGEMIIEERVILSSNASSKTVVLSGPNFGDNPAAFGSTNVVVGACATQINHPIVEPRFTSNLYLTDRSEAMQIINSMTSVFRGMATYVGGKISVTHDRFQNPIQLFNNSNVFESNFEYSGVRKNKKATAVMVRFNNKDKNFKPDLIYEEDARSMQSLGYVQNETMGFGITSEGQARRLAKWILLTSQLEIESIKFTTGQEASYLLPGSVFEVSDEARTNNDKSGRVLDVQLYRNRIVTDENEIQENVRIYDPYVLIDKENTSTPSYSRIEFTVYCGKTNETLDDINRRSSFEKSEDDQDSEIESLKTPQLVRFEGAIYTDAGINQFGPQGQKTIVSDLTLKLPIEISLPENLIKIYDHGFSNNTRLYFVTDGILPGGIKAAENNVANYYVVNATKHTFQISETANGNAVNIFSVGKDRFKNLGGLHYAVTTDTTKINDALDQINLGAAYSIKGLIATKSQDDISQQHRQGLGISENYANGWAKSDFLGSILLKGDWAYVYGIGWVYVKNLKERTDDNYWFYIQGIGWVWTNSTNKNRYWWIENKYYSTGNNWVHVLYSSSSRQGISGFFVYDSSASSISPLSNGSSYILGQSRKLTIRKRSTTSNPIGYFLSNEEPFSYYVEPAANTPVAINQTNPNYRAATIEKVYRIDEQTSVQGEDAVVVELIEGHGLNLDRNGKITIFGIIGPASPVNGSWHIIKVDENVIELVTSSSIAASVPAPGEYGSEVEVGSISLTENITSLVERFLEGQLFRTIGVKEISENKYEVTGLEYNYSKFYAVDQKGAVRTPALPIPPQADMSIPEAPDGLLLFDLTV